MNEALEVVGERREKRILGEVKPIQYLIIGQKGCPNFRKQSYGTYWYLLTVAW